MSEKQTCSTADPTCFATLFEKYKNLVFKTALLMTGEVADAEESLQEVFVLVYRSLDRYDPQKGALTTWLYRITVNYCLAQRRKPRLDCTSIDEGNLAACMPSAETDFSRLAEQEAMTQGIRRLSDKLRVVVVLRYYWELPYAEIAQILEIPLGTVKSRIDLAMRTLRQILSVPEEKSEPVSTRRASTPKEVRQCP